MNKIIAVLIIFSTLFLFSCGVQEDVGKFKGQLETIKASHEKLQEETCATYPYADGCDEVRKRLQNEREQEEIQALAIQNMDFDKCKDLVEEKDLVSCQYKIVLGLGDYNKCSLLPKKTSWGATFRDACYQEYATKEGNRDLCKKIELDSTREDCERHFRVLSASSEDLYENIFEGDFSNAPGFMAERFSGQDDNAILWWAKDFEITKLEQFNWNIKIYLKTKSGKESVIPMDLGFSPKEILFDNDPFASELPAQICNNNPACNGISWIYQTEFGYTIYCPSTIERCNVLVSWIKEYRGE